MKQYKVYYTPGAFGNFLGYLIDCYNNEKLLPSPFLPSGSSHGRYEYPNKTKVFPINLEEEYQNFIKEGGFGGFGLIWKSHYFFYILHAVYSRTNRGQYGECGIRIMQENFWKYHKMHESPALKGNNWNLLLSDLKNFYNFDCNENNQVVPRFILRQLFFFYIAHSNTNVVTIRNNEISNRKDLQLIGIDTILDYKQLSFLLGAIFGYSLDFSELHKKFINDNMSLKAYNLKNDIVNCVLKKIDKPILDIDVVTEAGIFFELEKYFYDIPFHNIPEFFKDTVSKINYIEVYPTFMKHPNPLFQKKFYKTIVRKEHGWFKK